MKKAKKSFKSFNHKTLPLTPNEMSFVQTLVGNGCSLEQALSLIGRSTRSMVVVSNANEEKVVSSKKDTKSADLDNKSKSRKSTSKVASNKSDKPTDFKVGNYVKVINLKNKKKIVNFGKITEIIDLKNGNGKAVRLNGAKKTSYDVKNCRLITKKVFGELKNASKKPSSKKDIAISNNSKRLPLYYYAMAFAYAIDKVDKDLDMLKQVKATALNDDKRLSELVADMRSRNLIKDFGAKVAFEVLKENSVEVKPINA